MRINKENGFTLVEAMVSITLLLICATMLSKIFMGITHRNFYSYRHTQAVILAQNKIEELLNEGYYSSMMLGGTYENPLNPVTSHGDSGGVFRQSWTIYNTTPIPRAKEIISIVRWDGSDGEEQEVRLTAVSIDQSN